VDLKDKIEICFPESESEIDLLTLPFKSTYRVLSWRGTANSIPLTEDFSLLDIQGKLMVIKSFRIIPYYSQLTNVDMYVNDGITTNKETLPIFARIDRLFDIGDNGTIINFKINGGPVNLFNAIFPLDVDLQNIYFKYPEKIQDITLSILGSVYRDIETGAQENPTIIVNMEVYLI
jgi:hypothetical protein